MNPLPAHCKGCGKRVYYQQETKGVPIGPVNVGSGYLPTGGSPTCSVDGCDRKRMARGWCSLHYYRWYRNPNGDLIGCWPPRRGLRWCDPDGAAHSCNGAGSISSERPRVAQTTGAMPSTPRRR